jgi:maleylacetate reductase
VTVGGGSITDDAKAVQLCLANDVRNAEAIDGLRPVKGPDGALGPPPDMKPPSVPQVTVPMTMSAGEFSAYSGITDERHRIKELVRPPLIIPRAVVFDPAVTVHTPEWLFLSTGIRAVDHCVEGICSSEANPYGDAQALHGLSLLACGLLRGQGRPRRSRGPATRRTRIRSAASMSTCTTAVTRSVPIGCSGAPTLRGCLAPGGNA